MNRYHHELPYSQNNVSNASADPFSSPQPANGSSGFSDQQKHFSLHSFDVFENTPSRRSTGESNSIARAIRIATDPEYDYPQQSTGIFEASTSGFVNYDDDASILAAVSSAHSSQKWSKSPPPSLKLGQKQKRKEKSKPTTTNGYASIFNARPKHDEDPLMQDFLSPDKIRSYHNRPRKSHIKQVRMDDFVFKARRVDKGAREFGLHTTHEPKRGSKKKRDSIEQLEVEQAELAKHKEQKRQRVIEQRKSEVENLDFSLAFGTPSPVRNVRKQSQKPESPKSFITFNDPNFYSNDSVFEATACPTPDKSILVETIPLSTPSPARKQMTVKRNTMVQARITGQSIFRSLKTNPNKRKDLGLQSTDQDRQPLMKAKRQKVLSNNKKPEFDYPSSPITLSDSENLQLKRDSPKRQTLRDEEAKRKKFGSHVAGREQMMRQLVNHQEFRDERENGGIEKRRAELKDGQVIRNKEMRKNLMHGAACKCCRGYYDGLDMEEQEKKDYINKVSRHRFVHKALPDTPDRYWDLTLGPRDDEDCEQLMTQQRNWEATSKKKKQITEPVGIHNWN